MVSRPDGGVNRFVQLWDRKPVEVGGEKLSPVQCLLWPDGHGVAVHILLYDINALAHGELQTAALPTV